MRNRSITYVCGLIAALATAAVFILSCNSIFEIPICWVALIFSVLSEVVTTVAFASANGKPHRVAGAVISLLQTVLTILISIVFINSLALKLMLKTFIGIYVVTFAVVIIAIIVAYHTSDNTDERKTELSASKSSLLRCRVLVQATMNSEAGKKYYEQLKKLDENIRFMDDGVQSPIDENLFLQLQALSEGCRSDGFDFEASLNRINDTINQRNFVVKSNKSLK